jgi:hypothetical protein
VLQAFVFNDVAVTVRHWFEVGEDGDDEHGTRIEVRALRKHPHRGSESAAQIVELDGIIWRADLFDRIGDALGSYGRAHHHAQFRGIEPAARDWDEELSADPFGWTERMLGDVAALADAAGVTLSDGDEEAADVRRCLPAIMAAAHAYAPDRCVSAEDCLQATRDTRDIVLLMVSQFRAPADGGPRDPRRSV